MSSILTISTILSCSSQENPPKIQISTNNSYSYKEVVGGLEIPWGMSFINENDLLVTEKSGILYRVTNGIKKKLKVYLLFMLGVKEDLLDVAISPNYDKTKEIYFTASSEIDTYNQISQIQFFYK